MRETCDDARASSIQIRVFELNTNLQIIIRKKIKFLDVHG